MVVNPRLLIVLALLGLPACHAAGDLAASGVACPALALNGPTMAVPKNGDAGVSDSLAGLLFTSNAQGGSGPILTSPGNAAIVAGPLTLQSNGQYASTIPTALAAKTTYSVTWNPVVQAGPCSVPVGTSGSFTTQ
jgi:hypothetical protein